MNNESSAYLLCDLGVSHILAKKLYDNGIKIIDLKNNSDIIEEIFGKGSLKKINDINTALEKIDTLKYNESIFILNEYGLSISIIKQLFEDGILLDDFNYKIKPNDLRDKFFYKPKTIEKIFDAISEYKTKPVNNKKFYIDYSDRIYRILSKISKNYFSYEEVLNILAKENLKIDEENLDYNLKILLSKDKIIIEDNIIKMNYPSLKEAISLMENKGKKEIFEGVLAGKYFADVGKEKGLTRERIRKVFTKSLEKMPKTKEDMYQNIFEKYAWEKDIFCDVFSVDGTVYEYLDKKYKIGSRSLDELIENNILDNVQKDILKKHLKLITYQGYTIIENKKNLLELILKLENRQIQIKELLEIYNKIVKKYFFDTSLVKIESDRVVEGCLDRSNYVIQSLNRKYRYYDYSLITEEEKRRLEEMLEVTDGMYTSRFFYVQDAQFMEEIDIKDEYELHFLLKKINNKKYIMFERMPEIYIGEKSREQFLLKEIAMLSPISLEQFISHMQESFGHEPASMNALLRKEPYNKYITNNIISTETKAISSYELEQIKSKMTGDFYTVDDVKSIITNVIKKDSIEYLNNMNLNKIGYQVREKYVYKKDIKSINTYIKENILNLEVYQEELYDFKNAGNSYQWTLCELLLENEIFKIADKEYITKKGLIKRGIDILQIKEMQNRIIDSYKENEYFNLYMLEKNKLISPADYFCFDKIFMESLLRYTPKIKVIQIEGNLLYVKNEKDVNQKDFINCVLKKYVPITIDELIDKIYNDYNIFLKDKYGIRALIDRQIFYINEDEKIFDR